MIGQFAFASCRSIGFRARALLRNTASDGSPLDPSAKAAMEPIAVDVAVHRDGELIATYPEFGSVEPGGIVEVSEATCPELGTEGEHLVIARCSRGTGEDYFLQEHQLIYEVPATRSFATVIFDQSPTPRPAASASPIVLLAPKVWVSADLACWVVFATTAADGEGGFQRRPLEISVLDASGGVVVHEERPVREQDVVVFDVRAAIADRVPLGRTPSFFDVVARGGAGSFSILTILRNEATGGCTVEHSLPPGYYTTEHRRLRDEALRLPAWSEGGQP